MRALFVAFGIGALIWTAVGRGDTEVTPTVEHASAVTVHVGSGPTGTARSRQLRGAAESR